MPDYLATFRYTGAKTPQQVQFQAIGIGSAIAELLMAAKVKDSYAFEDYEILEILEGGKAYKPVAAKIATNVPLRQEASRVTPLRLEPVTKPIDPKAEPTPTVTHTTGEQVYVPYKYVTNKDT